jgi:hypothetical protein
MSDECEAGDKRSCFLLRYAYERGEAPSFVGAEIVIKDVRRAAYYAGKGCALGEMGCCSSLADYYLYGTGVPQDKVAAVRLHTKVCNGPPGNPAMFSCGSLGSLFTQEYRDRAELQMGISYLARACALGNELSCFEHDRQAGTGRVSDREPPKGAIGFTFGWSISQAKTMCSELQGTWSPAKKFGAGVSTSCDLHVAALGKDVTATLGFLVDSLAWIQLVYDPGRGKEIGEHLRVGDLLTESWGKPSGKRSIVIDACGDLSFAMCLVKKQAEFETWWDFKDHQYYVMLSLVGNPNGTTMVSLLYSSPESESLVGNPGL